MTTKSAETIYQSNLDAVTRKFFTGDLSGVGDLIAIPSNVHTSDASLRIERMEDLLVMLNEQRESLMRLGTTEYHRICIEAAFANPPGTRIMGRHRTYVLRGGTYLMDPYLCEQTLVKEGSFWRASDIRCGLKNRDYTIVGPRTVESVRQSGEH